MSPLKFNNVILSPHSILTLKLLPKQRKLIKVDFNDENAGILGIRHKARKR